MGTPLTTMRIDADLKKAVQPVLEELGLNMTSAVNVFFKAVARTGGIPFDLKLAESQEHKAPFDFTAEYLSPIMSARCEINRAGFSVDKYRQRLQKRAELVNRERKTVM